jgi:hypothetical protein
MASWRQVTHVPVHSGCCILLARIYRPIGLLDGSLHLGCRIFKGVRYSVKLQLVQDSIYCVAPLTFQLFLPLAKTVCLWTVAAPLVHHAPLIVLAEMMGQSVCLASVCDTTRSTDREHTLGRYGVVLRQPELWTTLF